MCVYICVCICVFWECVSVVCEVCVCCVCVCECSPDVLVVDEPTAGLDPLGRRDMLSLFKRLKHELDLTLILVSHDMDDVLTYAERVVVMERGAVAFDGDPFDLFRDEALVTSLQLDVPNVLRMAQAFEPTFGTIPPALRTEAELADWIALHLRKEGSV